MASKYGTIQSTYSEASTSSIVDAVLAYGYAPQTNFSSAPGNDILLDDTIANLQAVMPKQLSVSLTPVAVAANTTAAQTFNPGGLSSLLTTDGIILTPPSTTAGVSITGNVFVSAGGTLSVTYANATAGSLTPPAGTYLIQILRS